MAWIPLALTHIESCVMSHTNIFGVYAGVIGFACRLFLLFVLLVECSCVVFAFSFVTVAVAVAVAVVAVLCALWHVRLSIDVWR